MSFPAYKKFAQHITDLLDFDDSNTLTVTRSTASGIKIKTETTSADALSAKVTGTVTDKALGKLVVESTTAGAFQTKAQLTKLADDVSVTITHNYKKNHSLKVAGDYSQKLFVVSGETSVSETADKYNATLKASVVGGAEGVVGGVEGVADIYPAQALTDYSAKIQYSQDDSYGAVSAEKKLSVFNIFLSQKIESNVFGVKVNVNTAAKDSTDATKTATAFTYTAVVERALDSATSAKLSYSDAGNVGFSLTHQLTNPAFKVSLSTASKPSWKNLAASSVNVAFTVAE